MLFWNPLHHTLSFFLFDHLYFVVKKILSKFRGCINGEQNSVSTVKPPDFLIVFHANLFTSTFSGHNGIVQPVPVLFCRYIWKGGADWITPRLLKYSFSSPAINEVQTNVHNRPITELNLTKCSPFVARLDSTKTLFPMSLVVSVGRDLVLSPLKSRISCSCCFNPG